MALSSPSMDVEEELQCPICKECLADPVTLDCGHNFCRGCITKYCETWEELGVLECPLCKAKITKRNFRPNWQLANIVDKINRLSLNPGKEDFCVSHEEKLNLFCREDQELMCVGCERSPAHQSHTVLLLGAAAEECRGIGRILQRSKKKEAFQNPVAFPPELTCRIQEFSNRKALLEGIQKQFQGKMEESLIKDKILKHLGEHSLLKKDQHGFYEAKVTLDPDTAHPQLILSEDRKSVRWGSERQDLPHNPERFSNCPVVLGSEGFTAGRRFWEVAVGSEGGWAVGVARKSVRRKGSFHFSPEKGIWALGKWGSPYTVLNSPDYTVSLGQEVKRLHVSVNCAKRNVTFSDAETGVHLYTYSGASFGEETLLPFFHVSGKAHLKLCP